MDVDWIVCCIVLTFLTRWSDGTHFRGAAFWWKAANGQIQNEVEISHRVAWRRSYSNSTYCDVNLIRSGKLLGPVTAGNLVCQSGCPGKVGNVNYQCTDFSKEEDWSGGTNTYSHVFPSSSSRFELRWSGRGWLETETHPEDAEWSLRMIIDLAPRSDLGGRPNSSPRAEMAPVVRLQLGCDMSVRIPVLDEDDDMIRCRWPESGKGECGGVCVLPPGVRLSVPDCRLIFETSLSTGYYVIAIQVEDFLSGDSAFSRPLSSVPVQFLAHVYQADSPCNAQPVFLAPTPEDGSCIDIQSNSQASLLIVMRTKDKFTRILEVATASSAGMIKGPILPYEDDLRDYMMNITWVVTSQTQQQIFCFAATDTTKTSSEQRCVYLITGAIPPKVERVTATPKGDTLFFQFDKNITLGDSDTGLTVYDFSTQENIVTIRQGPSIQLSTENNSTVVVTMPGDMALRGIYYIHMDRGFVRSTQSCSADSEAVEDNVSLQFFVDCPDPTDPPRTTTTTTTTTTKRPQTPEPTEPPTNGGSVGGSTSDDTDRDYIWIIVVVIVLLLLLILIIIIVIFVRRRQKLNKEKSSEARRLEHWAHLQNLRMGYDGPYQPDFNSLDVKFR